MSEQLVFEIIGYVASVLVAISLMMSSIIRLRVINLLGAITFTVYGLLITAYPVAAVNAFIVGVNIYYLWGARRTKETFHALEIDTESAYLHHFLDYHRKDIERFFPAFKLHAVRRPLIVMVVRDATPAGLLVGEVRNDGTLDVALDYVAPQYRDFKVGTFLFDESSHLFERRGVTRVVTTSSNDEHRRYLGRVGFHVSEAGLYERAITTS